MKSFLLTAALAFSAAAATSMAADPAHPNIVFILADDLGWGELGCYGQTKIRTPNIDRMAAGGMRFTQHYSGAPVCAPSRSVLMTGLHLGHTPIRGNRQATPGKGEGQWPIPAETVTLAKVFRDAGYATGAMGKWGLGPVGSSGDPNRQGFDLFFGINCQAVAHSFFPRAVWRNAEQIVINEKPIPGHAKQPEGEVKMDDWIGKNYAPDLMIAEAESFIAANAKKPFFLYLPFIEPHLSMHPPKRLVETYPAEWDTKPYRGQNGYVPHPRPHAGYAAMITHLDEHVGRVFAALERAGVADNTLVLFSSDNGTTHEGGDPAFGVGGVDSAFFNSTAGLRGFKGSVFEGGLRVPMIAWWPGRIAAGATCGFPSYFPDHFATLTSLSGLKVPGARDGVDLSPLLLGTGAPERNPMVWVFPEYGGQVAVRIGDYKVLRRDLNRKKPTPWMVFDIAKDPGETADLAAEKPELIDQAMVILRRETNANEVFPVVVPGL